ncbi:hypothetical protein [Sphingobacterium haloxyli]|uniref:Peptidase S74 domain-containing protein n=1 Tax=Sphingobacterium haloxyli TaxID=2100533 RepID=A0A2S9IWS9_9SPHI|nr:hypothetical protein [Sphingobacterium haloxyli]PRD44975.1 hypothetical protein C5745_18920 [Sphingobacterium haloxyli]
MTTKINFIWKACFLTLVTFGSFQGASKAQNSFPTAKGSYVTLDGGGIKMIRPVTTGGWARGTSYYQTADSPLIFGSGLNGGGEATHRFYLAYGASPWSSPLGMHILPNGNVGIGVISPVARLTVNGNILAKEIKVTNNITVPDYVFEPDYQLSSLSDIEAYVKEHKHLPEIPSAKDIERDGLDLGDMNLLLLKKVEELTLHLIEKEKKIGEQRVKMEALEGEIESIKKQLILK